MARKNGRFRRKVVDSRLYYQTSEVKNTRVGSDSCQQQQNFVPNWHQQSSFGRHLKPTDRLAASMGIVRLTATGDPEIEAKG